MLRAGQDAADTPPPEDPADAGLRPLEPAGVDVVAGDADEKETLNVTLGSGTPGECGFASPDRRAELGGIDRQRRLLHHLADQRRLPGFARLERPARREPPRLAIGKLAAKEQHALLRVDDERASGAPDRDRR